jgi:predicted dehydrogenase
VAVVEADEERRNAFADAHGISKAMLFATADDFFSAHPSRTADGLVLATREDVRGEPIRQSVRLGYHVLCEKPVAINARDAVTVLDAAARGEGIFMVCHQMRHTPLYGTFKQLIDSGSFGRLVNIVHSENVHFEHMAHSFVRGFFNNDALTPLVLAKACHDMDLLIYLAGARPLRVASFGSLDHFRPENAPVGAPLRCTDGCPAARECPYDVRKIYFRADTDPAYLRQIGVIRNSAHLMELLTHNRFGRCVFHCDNNVVDHQVCAIEFDRGITASFSLAGHNAVDRRRTVAQLTDGEIELDTSTNTITAARFTTGLREVLTPPSGGTHGGGDRVIMDRFVDAIRTGDRKGLLTTAAESLDSHLLAFAAEASRRSGQVETLENFAQGIRKNLSGEPGGVP